MGCGISVIGTSYIEKSFFSVGEISPLDPFTLDHVLGRVAK